MFNNKKLMFLSLLFVFVLSVGMVSAGDNATFEGRYSSGRGSR